MIELQNSKILKHWANDESGFMTGLLTVPRYFSKVQKGQFAQNLKNESDIYEHVQKVKILKHIKVLRIFRFSDQPIYLLSNFYKIFYNVLFTYTKMAKDSPATYYQIDEESHSKDEKNETIWTQTIEKSL